MTWIFWCRSFREERAMFVCSVFFSSFIELNFYFFCLVKLSLRWTKHKFNDNSVLSVIVWIFFYVLFLVFLQKTTWREYFDAKFLEKSEWCLCAPFFFLFFNYVVQSRTSQKSLAMGLVSHITVSFFVKLFLSFFCIRQHDVNILMQSFS